jgi:streptomycin 6-kinase
VLLHASHERDQTIALLLERCLPGTPLRAAAAEPEQDVIVAGLLRQLWRQPAAGHPFRPLQEMCDEWADRFEQQFEQQGEKTDAALDPGIARAGIALFRALPRTADERVLLCTDLHSGNILAARRAPWLVIDPKPYVGDPAYDALQHMLNCEGRLASDPEGLARRMAGLLGLDPGRLTTWLFARSVQESIGRPMLREVAARLAPG